MIDLHIHSTYSDGKNTIKEILQKANEKHLSCISITDHNTCKAYQELNEINVKKYYSGKIITGIELNTTALEIPIELLGYQFDIELMQKNLKGIYLTPEERNLLEVKRLYEKCIESKIDIGSNFVKDYSPQIYPSKYLHQTLIKNNKNKKYIDDEAWKDSLVLYRKYMSDPNSLFFVDTNDVLPHISTVIELIRKSHGKVFIPHIFEYKHNSQKILDYLLKNFEIDGIECYYSTFSEEENKALLDLCNKKKYFVSGGSDYHDINEFGIDIGIGKGNLNIPDSAILEWVK